MVPMMVQEKVPKEQFIYPGPEFPNTYTRHKYAQLLCQLYLNISERSKQIINPLEFTKQQQREQ